MDYFQVGHWGVTPVTTGASTEEFSSTAFRDHLRLSATSDDGLLGDKLAAARKRITGRTLRPFYREQFDMAIDKAPADGSPIRLPRFPVVSIDSVWSYDTEGSSSQFGSSGYFLDSYSEPPRLCLNSGYSWPSATRPQVGLVIRFTAGYSTGNTTDGRGIPAGVPDPLVEAVRKLATELYENREASSIGNSVNEPLPYGLEDLLSDYMHVEVG